MCLPSSLSYLMSSSNCSWVGAPTNQARMSAKGNKLISFRIANRKICHNSAASAFTKSAQNAKRVSKRWCQSIRKMLLSWVKTKMKKVTRVISIVCKGNAGLSIISITKSWKCDKTVLIFPRRGERRKHGLAHTSTDSTIQRDSVNAAISLTTIKSAK